ncbi:hypothetical protein P6144_18490 [Sphingomonas sp. HITSZ_GF]|uniref:hypothetical protein n=1 Tax=Sphingomonas sp. HITSZ_GF TaxID=3037247 RepID=UPI00240D3B11|nr:hypothetical protein [Sphingomonas sp. HITSZ_GF]MDG2535657.1 hypothetical protein [Sphingomonas sp. HITSZ_GF]
MQRPFIGDHGRPFGTVAALLCLVFTVALLVLGDVAHDLAGGSEPFVAIARGNLDAARAYWGLLLAEEIVRCVFAGALLLAMLTLAGPIGPRSPGRTLALLAGIAGLACLVLAAHFSIEAAAWLGMGRISPRGDLVATLLMLGHAGVALWAALTVREARAAGSLPRWVQVAGLAFAALVLVSGVVRGLAEFAGFAGLLWWGGIFLTLYRPQDRALR